MRKIHALSQTWVRLALSYAALLLLAVLLIWLLLASDLEGREESALTARLADQARAVAVSVEPLLNSGAGITPTEALAHSWSATFGTRVTIIRPDGIVVGDSEEDPRKMENHSTRPEVVAALAAPGTPGTGRRLSATVHRQLLYVAMAITGGSPPRTLGVARVAYPLTSVEQARNSLWASLALVVIIVTLPAIVFTIWLSRSFVGPLSGVRAAATRIGGGDLSARAPTVKDGEIAALARDFNFMAEQLQTTLQQRTAERNETAAVLAYMHDGVLITDSEGRITSMNQAAARLCNALPEEATGKSLIQVARSHELYAALREALAAGSQRKRLEIDLGPYRVAAVVTPVPSADGARARGLVVLQDITDLRRLERVRRDFVANIGHELRTPLASVKLLVETLRHAVREDPDAAADFISQVDVEVDGLTQLVRELLELSRIESGQVQLATRPYDAAKLSEEAAGRLRAQAERAGLDLQVITAPDLPQAQIDPEKLEQVLVNLIHNAIKFTNPGGSIQIRAERDGEYVLFSVSDTGIGIPPEELPRIFERFYKVDKSRAAGVKTAGGTGLGLAIAKHIVHAHGGQIWAESGEGRGTTFFFTVPVASRAIATGVAS